MDAMTCQAKIAKANTSKGADYFLAVNAILVHWGKALMYWILELCMREDAC